MILSNYSDADLLREFYARSPTPPLLMAEVIKRFEASIDRIRQLERDDRHCELCGDPL